MSWEEPCCVFNGIFLWSVSIEHNMFLPGNFLSVHVTTNWPGSQVKITIGNFFILSSACEEFELQFWNRNMLEKRMKLTGPRPEMVAVLNVSHSHRAWAELAARWHE